MADIRDVKNRLHHEELLKVLSESVYLPTEEKLRDIASACQLKESMMAYGYQQEGIFCGVIICDITHDLILTIREIAVLKSKQKQGIGSSLLDYVIKVYNPQMIIAETDDDAVGFYRKYGFRIKCLGEKYPGVIRYDCRYFRS